MLGRREGAHCPVPACPPACLCGTGRASAPGACITLPEGAVQPRSCGELRPILSSPEADLSTGSLPVRQDTRVPGVLPQRPPSVGSFPALLTSPPLLVSWNPRPSKPRVLIRAHARPGSIWEILSKPAGYWQMVGGTFRKVPRAGSGGLGGHMKELECFLEKSGVMERFGF